jgi:hypothetical protein
VAGSGGIQLSARSTQSIMASIADGEVVAKNSTNGSNGSNASNKTNATVPEPVDTGLDDNSTSPPEFAQIKLLGNNDGRTVGISTTETNITSTLSTHLNMNNHNSPKRPKGNKRIRGAKFAFVQDNGDDKQKWKKQRHPSQPADTFRLVDKTNHCLVANDP